MQSFVSILFWITFLLFGYTITRAWLMVICSHRMSKKINQQLIDKGRAPTFYYTSLSKAEVALYSDEGSEDMQWASKFENHKNHAIRAGLTGLLCFILMAGLSILFGECAKTNKGFSCTLSQQSATKSKD